MSAVHVSCRARARNILTPSSDMIVPAMTSSIASSPVIIPPCSSWERKGRDGHARHSGMRVRAMVRRTSRPLAHFRADRIIPPVQVSPLLRRDTPGPALERSGEGGRLRKVEGSGDLCQRQLRVGYELPGDFESELVEHGPESGACRLEIAIERAPVDGEPARSVVAGAAAGGETLPQAAFQLIDEIGAGNRLELADGALGGASERGVGRAHLQAEVPGRKDERRQLLVEPNGRAEERPQRGAVVRHAAGEVHLRRGPVAAAELAEYADDRREQGFDDDAAAAPRRSILQAAQHDGIVGRLQVKERAAIEDLEMILERADGVAERVAPAHERSDDAERRKARASPESDAEVRAARHLGTAGEKVSEHGDGDEILRLLQSSGRDARLRDDRATV